MRNSGGLRLGIGLLVALMAFLGYYMNTSKNPLTGESQRIAGITVQDEVQLGLQARGQVAAQFGGLSNDSRADSLVDTIGMRLVDAGGAARAGWQFDFHVLNDRDTVNAFALPGGQIFITEALLRRLKTEGQLAGVLGHEIGHVIERHGAQHMAKQQLTQGLTGAAVIASGDYRTAQAAQVIGGLINMKFGRQDELESDRWGVKLMSEAGYNPRSLIGVMKILKEASGGGNQPEFFSTHPNPENRIQKIEAEIKRVYPNGVPDNLKE
jgi:beta-barrel assembly-enhancing protease